MYRISIVHYAVEVHFQENRFGKRINSLALLVSEIFAFKVYFHRNFHFSALFIIPTQESGRILSNMPGNNRRLWYILRYVAESDGMVRKVVKSAEKWQKIHLKWVTSRELKKLELIIFFCTILSSIRFHSIQNGCDFLLRFFKFGSRDTYSGLKYILVETSIFLPFS